MRKSLETLQHEHRAGQRHEFFFFWGHTPSSDGRVGRSCLSQWWRCRFTIDGVNYTCTEQYMMAEKARLFGDSETLGKILEAKTPKEMKALGRQVSGFDAVVWERNGYEIVKRGNLAKFSQNEELREFLLTTEGNILAEASPYDRIWGIGMEQSHPDANNPLKWRGTNLLGFALTEVRDQLREKEAQR